MPLPAIDTLDAKRQLLDLDRADCEESLYEFYKAAWKYIDPAPWKDGWAIDAIAEHLQAVVDGQIRKLIINCPPRIGKSSLTSVAFPAWTWAQPKRTHTSGPGVPFLYASYNDKLSLRDSVKCRRLIESQFYKDRWGDRFKLVSDQNTKSRFTNDCGGERLITSIGAGVTGEGGNIICIDDPNAANEMESEATIETTIDWWRVVMSSRPNDLALSAFVIIQQRLAMNDLTGHILETEADGGWCHLCLPGRYDPERAYVTMTGWKDPRTVEGEPLWPERLSEASMKNLETTMGPFTFAGQIQQEPKPKGGGIIRREWWNLWDRDSYPRMDFIMATLDTAYTEKTINDPSAMIVWGIFSNEKMLAPTDKPITQIIGPQDVINEYPMARPTRVDETYAGAAVIVPRVMCMFAWTARLQLHELVEKVAKTAVALRVDLLMVENKASGISVAQEIRRLYSDYKFSVQLFDPKSQDKLARLYSVQHLFAEGLVYSPDTTWARMVMDEVESFPKGRHDDLVDCTSMAMRHLRDIGLLVRRPERELELEYQKEYRRQPEPLYPV